MTAADLGRDKDVGAGNSQQVQQLHGGVRGSSSSLGKRALPGIGGRTRRPLLGSLKQAGPPPSSPPWGGRLRLRAYTRENQSGCERWALFFFLTEKGSGAQTPGLEAYRKDVTLGCTHRSLLTPPGCEAACSSGGTAVTETATL